MSDYVVGLLYDGQREPASWLPAAARGGYVEVVAPREGQCRMVARHWMGGPILWRGPDRNVQRGMSVVERFGLA